MSISQYDNLNYASYQPLSIQEIWAPSQQMRQQHDQLQEEYANAEQAAQQGFSGLNPEVDKEALAIHKQFMDQTKAAADELATKGFIDSGRRRSLLKLKSVYTNQVAPLQQQIALRASRNEELRKMQLQDPTFRATANPNQVSLVSGLKNPNAFDYDGVSGNQLYSSVSKKAEQLAKVISQEHPKLMNSGIFANYFTALQSGASLDQIDRAMKSGGRYNPQDVDKMTQMLHGIVGSTMNEFGVPSKFAGNEAVQQDLWNAAAQGLYSAAGTKQFGQMQDDMALYNRKKVLETPPEAPGKTHREYDASFDEKNFDEINKLVRNASWKTGSTSQKPGSGTNMYLAGKGAPTLTFDGKPLKTSVNNTNLAQQELFKRAKEIGFKLPSKIANKDLPAINERIAEALKDQFRTANLSRHYFNPSEETGKKFTAAISEMDKIVDVNGNKIDRSKIFSESGKLVGDAYLVRGKNGTTLKTVDRDGKQISIPFDISKLGSITLRDYDAQIQHIKSDIETKPKAWLKSYYGDPQKHIENYENAIDDILTSEQYTQTKSQDTNPGYSGYGR